MSISKHNMLCPCGSGAESKRCCGAPAKSSLHFPTVEGRIKLTRLLYSFMERERDEGLVDGVLRLVFGGRIDAVPPQEFDVVFDSSHFQVNFTMFLMFDFVDSLEGSYVQRFLAGRFDRITAAERRYLQALCDSYVGFYEITAVVPGEGVQVLDLLGGDTFYVRDAHVPENVERWDLLGARVLRDPSTGENTFIADLYPIPRRQKEPMLALLRAELRIDGSRRFDAERLRPRLKLLAPLFARMWWDAALFPQAPVLQNLEGQEFVLTTTTFDVTDLVLVSERLDACADLEADDEDIQWRWKREVQGQSCIVAFVRLDDGQLQLLTTSPERAAEGRALLEGLLGDLLRFRSQSMADPRELLAERRSRDDEEEEPRPDERDSVIDGAEDEAEDEHESGDETDDTQAAEAAESVRMAYLERYYRAWVDQPVPLLDGRTPRQAAGLKTQRHKVVDLIKGLENLEAHRARTGVAPYDCSWMWADLGLEDPRK